MEKQPKKVYQVMQQMDLNELAESLTLYAYSVQKLLPENTIQQMTEYTKEWLLGDVQVC